MDKRRQYYKRVYFAASVIFFIFIIGVCGFMCVEGYTFLEAFYMTIITVATVGFQEVHPLSDGGKLFTAFLIISSIGTYAVAISVISAYIAGGEFSRYYRTYKVMKSIEKLQDHVIVCGYGQNGRQACEALRACGQTFVLIESDINITAPLKDDSNFLIVEGNATQDEVLMEAGIKKAKALITALPSDADNVFVTLTSREINSKLLIISRATDASSEKKLRRAGADNVIMPDKIGGSHMAALVMKPDVIEFIDYITGQGGVNIGLEEIAFDKLADHLQNKTIRSMEVRNRTGANIVGFKTIEGEFIVNPSPDTLMQPGAKLFVLGTSDQVANLKKLMGC
jgi:voltage-gated potassium channel